MEIVLGILLFIAVALFGSKKPNSSPTKKTPFDREEDIWDETYDDADDADEGDGDDN